MDMHIVKGGRNEKEADQAATSAAQRTSTGVEAGSSIVPFDNYSEYDNAGNLVQRKSSRLARKI